MRSFYDTLGVSPDATADDIRLAFRRIAKERHPDMAAGNESAMKRLNDAYETLRDADRRTAYDRSLQLPVRRRSRPPPRPRNVALDPEAFLAQVFRPLERAVMAAVRDLHGAVTDLRDAVADDEALTAFDLIVVAVEADVNKAQNRLASVTWPSALTMRLTRYRDGLGQLDAALAVLGRYSLHCDDIVLDDGSTLLRAAVAQLAPA
jgi:molecular chaperone DnaJ